MQTTREEAWKPQDSCRLTTVNAHSLNGCWQEVLGNAVKNVLYDLEVWVTGQVSGVCDLEAKSGMYRPDRMGSHAQKVVQADCLRHACFIFGKDE